MPFVIKQSHDERVTQSGISNGDCHLPRTPHDNSPGAGGTSELSTALFGLASGFNVAPDWIRAVEESDGLFRPFVGGFVLDLHLFE